MENTIVMILSALISGLIATGLTLFWQHRYGRRNERNFIFKTLMAYRFHVSNIENVKALNMVEVVFHDENEVSEAYRNFILESRKKEGNETFDMYITLLEKIAKSLKYKNIDWSAIKNRNYCPDALSDRINEEEMLRKLMLETAKINRERTEQSAGIAPDQVMGMQVLTTLLQNPTSLEHILKFAGKSQNQKNR